MKMTCLPPAADEVAIDLVQGEDPSGFQNLAGLESGAELVLFDAAGRTVLAKPLKALSTMLARQGLPAGAHTVQVRTGGRALSQKLVKLP